jgi:hypothetical protein
MSLLESHSRLAGEGTIYGRYIDAAQLSVCTGLKD